jgi:hypothetical protein
MDRYWRSLWKRSNGATAALIALLVVSACGPAPDALVRQYVESANRHDLAALEAMLSDDVVWYLGLDTLVGKTKVLEPLDFDVGAQTHLELGTIVVRGDTAEFDLAEHNRVIMALGIHELMHYVRFVFRDGLIAVKEESRPAGGLEAFADSVASFASWLSSEEPEAYERIWGAGGKFVYSRSTAELMFQMAERWRARDGS